MNTYTHSPMINKKSVKILNQKFKRERQKNDQKTQQKQTGNNKQHHEYNKVLKSDKKVVSLNKKTNNKYTPKKISNANKSRIDNLKDSKTHQPMAFGKKNSAKVI